MVDDDAVVVGTTGGQPVSEELIRRFAREAEQGYDVEILRPKRRRKTDKA